MPVLANNISLTAGSSSVNVFDNTNYQFVNEGTEIRVSAAVVGANDGIQGANVNTGSQSTTQSSLTTRSYQLLLPDNRLLTVLQRIEPTRSSLQDRLETARSWCSAIKRRGRL